MDKPKESLTAQEAVEALAKIVKDGVASESKGACVYEAAGKVYCADTLTEGQCKTLKGIWTDGGKCPK